MQDMELPLPKRCKVSSQGSGDDILKILRVDETSLLCDAFSDLPQSEEGSILREIEDDRAMVAQHGHSSLWHKSLQHVVQGAICVHRLRLLDISRREEVFFLELIEGSSRHVRAHGGQCADKLPERLPYAIQTHLVELRGWKRFEFNQLPKFVGVDQETVSSLFPRSLVVRYKASRLDRDYILSKIHQPEVEAEMQDMELPLPKRCKVSSQGSGDDILKILRVDETSLLCDAFSDLPQSEEGSILREIEDDRAMEQSVCIDCACWTFLVERKFSFSSSLKEARGMSELTAANNGVIPQGVLARCKKFLLFLEGLYRLLPTDTLRTPESIINAVSLLLHSRNNSAEFLLQECEKAAICGSPIVNKKRRTAAIAQDDEVDAAGEQDDNKPWTQVMASTVGKLYVKLQSSLLHDHLIKYYVEWCGIDVQKTGSNNVYVFLPHRFFGVDEETFNSLFRRSLLVRYKASFLDSDYILSKIQQPEERGIFPKDPTLKDFLRSSPACLVTLRALWQYARDHNAADCRKCLDEYVVGGKDEGLTELCVRQACGLKHTSKPEDPAHDVDTSKTEGQPPAVSEEVLAVLRKQRDEIASWMIQVKKDFCTRGQLRSVKGKHAWTAFSRQDVDDVLHALAAHKLMHKSSLTLPRLGLTDVFSPKVSTTKSMTDVVDMKHDDAAAFSRSI
ncbi:unnamed protein product [Symbiodinium sp. CCMP2592]|nr:unnamed protein product [Symbiodinium sp. CCMP2592]CAE7335347.1 unnamed protein product [Symbiodinium sp. CCMP2592]